MKKCISKTTKEQNIVHVQYFSSFVLFYEYIEHFKYSSIFKYFMNTQILTLKKNYCVQSMLNRRQTSVKQARLQLATTGFERNSVVGSA